MPNTIERMERKRPRKCKFERHLHQHRPRRKRRRQARRVQRQTQHGGHEVQGAEDVEGAGDYGAGYAVQGREDPGDLWPVDAEVRGDGAVESLLCED